MSSKRLARPIAQVVVSLAALAAGLFAFWWLSTSVSATGAEAQGAGSGIDTVDAALVTPAESPPVISQTGFVRTRRAVDLAFLTMGRVAELSDVFAVGRAIDQGAVIATLVTTRSEADVARAEAEVERAQAGQMEADAALARARALEDRNVASEAQLDDAIARQTGARAALTAAQAGLTAARETLDDTTLAAPFRGVVAAVDVAPGQIVQPGAPIGRLIEAGGAEVRVAVTGAQLAALRGAGGPVGLAANIYATGPAGNALRRGEVTEIAPELTQGVRLTELIVTFPDPFFADPPVEIGQLVRVEIPLTGGGPYLSFPVNALRGTDAVWAITEAGTLAGKSVDLVLLTDERAFVRDGALDGATRLLLTDLALAEDGMEVRVAEGQGE